MLGLENEVWVANRGDQLMQVFVTDHGGYIAGAQVQRFREVGHENPANGGAAYAGGRL
jgi:hypothetical protein